MRIWSGKRIVDLVPNLDPSSTCLSLFVKVFAARLQSVQSNIQMLVVQLLFQNFRKRDRGHEDIEPTTSVVIRLIEKSACLKGAVFFCNTRRGQMVPFTRHQQTSLLYTSSLYQYIPTCLSLLKYLINTVYTPLFKWAASC